MTGAVDVFTLVRGCVVATGWSDAGRPMLTCDDRVVASTVSPCERPDLVDHFGERARWWGFRLAAALGEAQADPERLAIRMPGAESVGMQALARVKNRDGALVARFGEIVRERGGRLLEIGSRARSGVARRDWFPDTVDYTGLDIKAGPNVHLVGDAHALSALPGAPYDFVFSISVFEHLLMPWKAVLEMNVVMREGGLAFVSSHPSWPLHETPWDFWRFSDRAWHGLFNAHTGFEVVDTEQVLEALIAPVSASSGPLSGLDRETTYLSSSCLARKVGPPQVAWAADVSKVYDLGYSHG